MGRAEFDFSGSGSQEFGFRSEKFNNNDVVEYYLQGNTGSTKGELFFDFITGKVVRGEVEVSGTDSLHVALTSKNGMYGLDIREDYDGFIGALASTLEQTQVNLLQDSNWVHGSYDGGSLKIRTLGGSDVVQIHSGSDNWVNANWDDDQVIIGGDTDGIFRGGKGNDRLGNHSNKSVFINGNQGDDRIESSSFTPDNAVFRGGAGNDILHVVNGEVYGDEGADTFYAFHTYGSSREGYAVVKDFSIAEDKIEGNGFFKETSRGLMYVELLNGSGEDELLLLEGIYDASGITVI